MAAPKRKPALATPDLSSHSDFQLLNSFTTLVSKELSPLLMPIAWEIMRRYSRFLDTPVPTKAKDFSAILGDARWGDAKWVEAIFGIKRGVLKRLREAGLIKSNSLEEDGTDAGTPPAARAKRLYELISIDEYLDSCADEQNPS